MAQNKVAFTKLGLKLNNEVKAFKYNNFDIEVKQYLPVEERLEVIAAAVNAVLATDANKFLNPVKLRMYLELEMVFHFTNITFTDKQKENLPKLYDLLEDNCIISNMINCMPTWLYDSLMSDATKIAERMYEYSNSAYGILDSISNDYENLDLDIEALKNKLANADNLDIVKDVVTKLG